MYACMSIFGKSEGQPKRYRFSEEPLSNYIIQLINQSV